MCGRELQSRKAELERPQGSALLQVGASMDPHPVVLPYLLMIPCSWGAAVPLCSLKDCEQTGMSSHCMESFKRMSAPCVHPIFLILAHVDTGAP